MQTSSVESSDARWAKIAETMIPYTAQAVEAVEAKERIRSSRAARFESKAGDARARARSLSPSLYSVSVSYVCMVLCVACV